MREQPLFDKQDGVARAVEGDGAMVLCATADSNVHFWNQLNQQLVK
jgi:hypothetical protein